MTMPKYPPIYASQGYIRLVGGTATETSGKDISADVFKIGLGPSGTVPPDVASGSAWKTPTINTVGPGLPLPNQYGIVIPATAQRILLLSVDNTVAAGVYYAWAKIPDSPEIEPVFLAGPFTVS